MIIGFLLPSNWEGANLVTHELHIKKKQHPGNETASCFLSTSSPYFSGESELGSSLYGAGPGCPGNLLERPHRSPLSSPGGQEQGGMVTSPAPGRWEGELACERVALTRRQSLPN